LWQPEDYGCGDAYGGHERAGASVVAGVDATPVLQLRNKTPKRRVKAKLREDRAPAVRHNDVWAMDFVHDQLATGRKLRILTVVDTFSRFSPVIDARFSYRGEDVVTTLDRTCRKVGYPKTIRVDNGSEFVSRDMDLWAYQRGVTLELASPPFGSHGLASPRTMPSSKRSTASCAANA